MPRFSGVCVGGYFDGQIRSSEWPDPVFAYTPRLVIPKWEDMGKEVPDQTVQVFQDKYLWDGNAWQFQGTR
jgi:hypothetical protein